VPFGHGLRHDREQGGGAAVHDGGAKTPHQPHAVVRVGSQVQVVDVFDKGKTRPDREPQDTGVDQETYAVGAEQEHNDAGLDRLLNQRRYVAGITGEIERDEIDDEGVDPGANQCAEAQAVAVEAKEHDDQYNYR